MMMSAHNMLELDNLINAKIRELESSGEAKYKLHYNVSAVLEGVVSNYLNENSKSFPGRTPSFSNPQLHVKMTREGTKYDWRDSSGHNVIQPRLMAVIESKIRKKFMELFPQTQNGVSAFCRCQFEDSEKELLVYANSVHRTQSRVPQTLSVGVHKSTSNRIYLYINWSLFRD